MDREPSGGNYCTMKSPFSSSPPSPCTSKDHVLVHQSLGMVNNRHTPPLAIVHRQRSGPLSPPLHRGANKGARCCSDIKVKQTGLGPPASWPVLRSNPRGVTTFGLSYHTSKFAPHTNSAHGFASRRPRADIQPLYASLILCFPK